MMMEKDGKDGDEHNCTDGRDDAGLYVPLRSIGCMPCIVAEEKCNPCIVAEEKKTNRQMAKVAQHTIHKQTAWGERVSICDHSLVALQWSFCLLTFVGIPISLLSGFALRQIGMIGLSATAAARQPKHE